MKNCDRCKYAEWARTAAGKLHPSGDGKCIYPVKLPALPASMQWQGDFGRIPHPCGGSINRRKELGEHCATYQRKETES